MFPACSLVRRSVFWIKGQKHVQEFQKCLKDVTECLPAETKKMLSARSDVFVIYSHTHEIDDKSSDYFLYNYSLLLHRWNKN